MSSTSMSGSTSTSNYGGECWECKRAIHGSSYDEMDFQFHHECYTKRERRFKAEREKEKGKDAASIPTSTPTYNMGIEANIFVIDESETEKEKEKEKEKELVDEKRNQITTTAFDQDFEMLKFISLSYQNKYNKVEMDMWKKISSWFGNDTMKKFILNMIIKGVVHQFERDGKTMKTAKESEKESEKENEKDEAVSSSPPKFNPSLKMTLLDEKYISDKKYPSHSQHSLRFPGNPIQEAPMSIVYDLPKLEATIGGIVHAINCMNALQYNVFFAYASVDTFSVTFYIVGN